jgi:hypothetical protein
MSLDPQVIVGIIGGLVSIGIALTAKFFEASTVRRLGPSRTANSRIELANEKQAPDPFEPAVQRLDEARDMLRRQQSIAKSNRWISTSLTVGQYIIGGLLASSFLQQSLSSNVVGLLGLLVLVSSLLFQHFRPDIRLRGALARTLLLKTLIRTSEDDLYSMRCSDPSVDAVYGLRKRISDGLSRIEASELDEMPIAAKTKTNEHHRSNQALQPTAGRSDN